MRCLDEAEQDCVQLQVVETGSPGGVRTTLVLPPSGRQRMVAVGIATPAGAVGIRVIPPLSFVQDKH